MDGVRRAAPLLGLAVAFALFLMSTFATTPGGNLLGAPTAVTALLILLTGAARRPAMAAGLIATMLACAFALSIAMYALLGTTSIWHILVAAVLAGTIAVSTRLIAYRRR